MGSPTTGESATSMRPKSCSKKAFRSTMGRLALNSSMIRGLLTVLAASRCPCTCAYRPFYAVTHGMQSQMSRAKVINRFVPDSMTCCISSCPWQKEWHMAGKEAPLSRLLQAVADVHSNMWTFVICKARSRGACATYPLHSDLILVNGHGKEGINMEAGQVDTGQVYIADPVFSLAGRVPWNSSIRAILTAVVAIQVLPVHQQCKCGQNRQVQLCSICSRLTSQGVPTIQGRRHQRRQAIRNRSGDSCQCSSHSWTSYPATPAPQQMQMHHRGW